VSARNAAPGRRLNIRQASFNEFLLVILILLMIVFLIIILLLIVFPLDE